MKTHFYKTKLRTSVKLPSVLHSWLYNELPNDSLFTMESIKEHVLSLAKMKPFLLKDVLPQSQWPRLGVITEEVIGQLVSERLGVLEIHFTRLEKLIKEVSKA